MEENKIIKGQFRRNPHIFEIFIAVWAVVAIGFGISKLAKGENSVGFIILIVGCCLIVFSALGFGVGAGRYLIFDGKHISAKCGMFVKLECDISEIRICSTTVNSVSVILNNGQVKTFGPLLNAQEVNTEINKCLKNSIPNQSFDELKAEYDAVCKKRKREIILMVVFLFLMLAGILFAAAVTGFKDISDMTGNEKILLYVSFGFDLIFMVLAFVFAKRGGRLIAKVSETGRMANRWVLCNTKPKKPYRSMFRMADDMTRVVLYNGFSTDEVYFEVEMIDDKYELHVIGVSPKMKLEDFDTEGLIKIENG